MPVLARRPLVLVRARCVGCDAPFFWFVSFLPFRVMNDFFCTRPILGALLPFRTWLACGSESTNFRRRGGLPLFSGADAAIPKVRVHPSPRRSRGRSDLLCSPSAHNFPRLPLSQLAFVSKRTRATYGARCRSDLLSKSSHVRPGVAKDGSRFVALGGLHADNSWCRSFASAATAFVMRKTLQMP